MHVQCSLDNDQVAPSTHLTGAVLLSLSEPDVLSASKIHAYTDAFTAFANVVDELRVQIFGTATLDVRQLQKTQIDSLLKQLPDANIKGGILQFSLFASQPSVCLDHYHRNLAADKAAACLKDSSLAPPYVARYPFSCLVPEVPPSYRGFAVRVTYHVAVHMMKDRVVLSHLTVVVPFRVCAATSHECSLELPSPPPFLLASAQANSATSSDNEPVYALPADDDTIESDKADTPFYGVPRVHWATGMREGLRAAEILCNKRSKQAQRAENAAHEATQRRPTAFNIIKEVRPAAPQTPAVCEQVVRVATTQTKLSVADRFTGVLDFDGAKLPCYRAMITLESEEYIPPTLPAIPDAYSALLASLVAVPPPSLVAPDTAASSAGALAAPSVPSGKAKELVPEVPAAKAPPINLYMSLYVYFLEHNPDKIVDIPCLVRRFDNPEGYAHLYGSLLRKYGHPFTLFANKPSEPAAQPGDAQAAVSAAPAAPSKALYKVHSSQHLYTQHHLSCPFSLSFPADACSAFSTPAVSLGWIVRFKFIVGPAPAVAQSAPVEAPKVPSGHEAGETADDDDGKDDVDDFIDASTALQLGGYEGAEAAGSVCPAGSRIPSVPVEGGRGFWSALKSTFQSESIPTVPTEVIEWVCPIEVSGATVPPSGEMSATERACVFTAEAVSRKQLAADTPTLDGAVQSVILGLV